MTSFECALCRYGPGKSVRKAIMKTLESIYCGLIQMKGFVPKNETKLVQVARYIKKEFMCLCYLAAIVTSELSQEAK